MDTYVAGREADRWTNERADGERIGRNTRMKWGIREVKKRKQKYQQQQQQQQKSPSFISHTLVHFSCFDIIIGISISDGVQELQAIKYKNI